MSDLQGIMPQSFELPLIWDGPVVRSFYELDEMLETF